MKEKLFIRLNRRIKRFLLNLATKYIRHCAKDSNYIKYAINEFNIAYEDWKEDEMQNLMCNQVLELLSVLDTHGDSGFSIQYKLSLLNKLIRFQPIKPLTFKENEWRTDIIDSFDNSRQNIRDSRYFLYLNGDIHYNDDIIKVPTYYIGESKIIIKRRGASLYGIIHVLDENGKVYRLNIKLKKPYTYPNPTISVPIYEIEYPSDWWLNFAKYNVIEDIKEHYDVEVIEDRRYLKEEVEDFKDGIYKKELMDRIELMKRHMYCKDKPSTFKE